MAARAERSRTRRTPGPRSRASISRNGSVPAGPSARARREDVSAPGSDLSRPQGPQQPRMTTSGRQCTRAWSRSPGVTLTPADDVERAEELMRVDDRLGNAVRPDDRVVDARRGSGADAGRGVGAVHATRKVIAHEVHAGHPRVADAEPAVAQAADVALAPAQRTRRAGVAAAGAVQSRVAAARAAVAAATG